MIGSKKKDEKKQNFENKTLAKHTLDLAEFVDDVQEKTTTKEIILTPESKKNSSTKILVKIVVNCKCLKDVDQADEDFENVSTFSGTYREGEQDDDEKSEDEDDIAEAERVFESTIIKNSTFTSVSTIPEERPVPTTTTTSENKISAPVVSGDKSPRKETLSDRSNVSSSSSNTGTASSVNNSRVNRELEEKFHFLQVENEQLRLNLDTAQESAQKAESKLFEIQLKMQSVQSKADKEIKLIEEKMKELEKDYKNKESTLVTQHEKDVKRLQTEMDSLRTEMNKKNSDLQNDKEKTEKTLKNEIERLSLELKQANERFTSNISSSQSSHQQEIQRLQTELSEIKKKKEDEQKELQKQISELNSQKTAIEKKKLEFENSLRDLNQKYLQLEKENKEKQQELHNVSQKLEKEIKEKETITSTLQNEKKLLTIEIEELKNKFSETEKKGTQQSTETSKLLETLKTERETLSSQLTQLQKDHKELELSKSDVSFKLQKVEENLTQKEQDLTNLQKELEKTRQENSTALQNANTKIDHLQIDLENLNQKEIQLNETINQQTNQINQLKNDVNEKDRNIQELQQRITNQDNEIKKLNDEISELNQTIQSLENDLNEKEFALKKELETSRKLNDDLTSALVQVQTLENQMVDKDDRINELESKIEQHQTLSQSSSKDLEKKLSEKDEKLLEAQKDISKLKTDKKKADEKIKGLEEQVETLQLENMELNELIEKASKRMEDKDKQMKRAEETNKKAIETAESKVQKEKKEVEYELERTKIDLVSSHYAHIERFVLDRVVMNSQTNDFLVLENLSKIYFKNIMVKEFLSDTYPTPSKILLKCLQQWNPEEAKNATLDSKIILGKTFGVNLILSLNYLLEKFQSHRNKINTFAAGANESGEFENSSTIILYWVHTLYRLIHDLELKKKDNFSKIFEDVPTKIIKLDPALLVAEDTSAPRYVVPPTFVKYQDLELLDEEYQFTSLSDIVLKLSEVLVQMYAELFRHVIVRLKPYLFKSVFNSKLTSSKSTDGGQEMRNLHDFLNRIFDTFKQLRIEPRIVQHFFENLALISDALVFNHFLTKEHIGASVALPVKMGLLFVENWFNAKNIIGPDSAMIAFHLSREASDVCILAQKQILTDEEMRKVVCPHLTKNQIAYIFSNFFEDDFKKPTSPTSSESLPSLNDSHSGTSLNISALTTPRRSPSTSSLSLASTPPPSSANIVSSPMTARRKSIKLSVPVEMATELGTEVPQLEKVVHIPEISVFKYLDRQSYGVDPSAFYGTLGPLASLLRSKSEKNVVVERDSPRHKLNKDLEIEQSKKEAGFLVDDRFLFYFSGSGDASSNLILEEWLFSVISNHGGKRENGVEGLVKIPRERMFNTSILKNSGDKTSRRPKKPTLEDELAFLFEL